MKGVKIKIRKEIKTLNKKGKNQLAKRSELFS
jgi:hypothetical protein